MRMDADCGPARRDLQGAHLPSGLPVEVRLASRRSLTFGREPNVTDVGGSPAL